MCFIITSMLSNIIGGCYNIVIGSVIHNRRYVCFTLTGMLSNSTLHSRWYGGV